MGVPMSKLNYIETTHNKYLYINTTHTEKSEQRIIGVIYLFDE